MNSSGPVISPAAKTRIEGLIASVDEEGGKILLDGRGYQVPGYPEGNWVGPTVVEATTTMRAYRYVYTTPSHSIIMLMTLFIFTERRSLVRFWSSSPQTRWTTLSPSSTRTSTATAPRSSRRAELRRASLRLRLKSGRLV